MLFVCVYVYATYHSGPKTPLCQGNLLKMSLAFQIFVPIVDKPFQIDSDFEISGENTYEYKVSKVGEIDDMIIYFTPIFPR